MALALLAFTAAALVPGFVSSTDTLSLLRVFGALVPLAVLAAIGFVAIANRIERPGAQRWAAAAAVVAIGASRTVIFDVVNRRILPDSSPGLIARSVGATPAQRVAVLTAEGENAAWRYVEDMMRYVPRQPITVVAAESLPPAGEGYDLFLWSAAVEQTAGLNRRICALWPGAALYDIVDRAGLSRAHAAARAGSDWVPALPAAQWTARSCTTVN